MCYPGQQYEELKKAKEDVMEECAREKAAHRNYKKECAALKQEYSIIKQKVSVHVTCMCHACVITSLISKHP